MTIESLRRFEIKHRASLPGYDWPVRWEHERGDAYVPRDSEGPTARAGGPDGPEPVARSQPKALIAIAGGKK